MGKVAFRDELEALLNGHSMENGSNTPDFILANYLSSCLAAFDAAVRRREEWYGRNPDMGPAGMLPDAVVHQASPRREFDAAIGRLDRALSDMMTLANDGELDEADRQTLKHHADDLVGVAESVRKKIGASRC